MGITPKILIKLGVHGGNHIVFLMDLDGAIVDHDFSSSHGSGGYGSWSSSGGAGSQAEAAATTKKDVWVCSVCNKKRGNLILCDSCVSRCPMVGILWDIYPTI